MNPSASPEAQALLERWRAEDDIAVQAQLLQEILDNGIFPTGDHPSWESDGGLYPDLQDENFLPTLMRKREFQESKQKTIKESMEEGIDRCRSSEDFELSSVQRFVSRFLSPRTPYTSGLFYHGVGVGKTCAAITLCESYLEVNPGRKVYIIAPPNIQEGFRRTIFDTHGLTIRKSGKNSHRGCTGDIYLALTNTFDEQNRKTIETKVAAAIKSRYVFFGYTSFYNYIRSLLSHITHKGPDAERLKRKLLQEEFSNRMMVVDEAHNLRDNPTETDDDVKDDTTLQDSADSKAGKKLTPFLKEVLEVSEATTLVLMTATPMYNSYIEIIFLLNLLLINDKFPTISVDDVFDQRAETFTANGRTLLGKIASQYVSFMRGENPLTFPLRLEPLDDHRISAWASTTPKGNPISDGEREAVVRLPCLACPMDPRLEALYKGKVREIVSSSEGLGITNMDILIQAGNWMYPGEDDEFLERIRQNGFDSTFMKEKKGSTVSYRSTDEERGASWLLEDQLPLASGKAAVLVKRLAACRGPAFVYSRFVASGALTIALCLEANGYTPYGRDTGYLADGNQHPGGRQCALCPRHERGHGRIEEEAGTPAHTFKPAKFVLLTGSEDLSPNNAASITAARKSTNVFGEDVKVVIGSQVAGEGLDLRYIREIMVYDSWYHLNKLEQVVGRGIRNCSHASLPTEMRNCTVTLLVNSYVSEPETESIDCYSYRQALKKAATVGQVTRVLKEYAVDCTLNRDAIVVEGLDPLPVVRDSTGFERLDVDINDTPLTVMCDWMETCDYTCKAGDGSPMQMDIPLGEQDTGTYDEYTARYQMSTIRAYIEDLLSQGQPFVTFEKLQLQFETIPRALLASLMSEMVQQREFNVHTPMGDGRIIYRNGYYVFQPDGIADIRIPISIRLANIPVPRDVFEPRAIAVEEEADDIEGLVGTEAAKKIAAEGDDSEELWNQAVEWRNEIANGTVGIVGAAAAVPDELIEEVKKLRESAGIIKSQKERLEMILWMYAMVKDDVAIRTVYADVVLEYLWDEFVSSATKRELLSVSFTNATIRKVAADSFWLYEGQTYIRLLNSFTNEIEYICVDPSATSSSPCPKAVVEVLSKERGDDPLLQKAIDVRHTGSEYGFLLYNPKKRRLVFKKGKPPAPGGKVTRGSECAINSATGYEIELLKRLGGILRADGKHDLGLNDTELDKRKRFTNSIRVCTVCDLALRMMNAMKVKGKRWYYRALESKLHGHPLR